ncbi:MAG TPA: hypothetical protein VFC47_10355 [Caulobacteraceae bacterium]|nr:hypothetical protein [Caulobacteraceae bacterium]
MKRLYLLVACLALVPLLARAEASNYCLWMLLVDTHAVAMHCGQPLSPAAEQRYHQLRQAADEEMVRDARLSPGGSPEKVKTFMTNYMSRGMSVGAGFPGYCASRDAPMVLRMLGSFTSKENTAKILAGLLIRKNPFDGDCL